MGSKNYIARLIGDILPPAENFYDLFCGGGAILHRCLELQKYKNYYGNDLNPLPIQGLTKAFNGEYKHETRWISREDFFKFKDTDFYVYSCFSFGNIGSSYCYGQHMEPWKKALHYARVFNDFSLIHEIGLKGEDFSRMWIKRNAEEVKKKYVDYWCEVNNIDRVKLEPFKKIININQFSTEEEIKALNLKNLDNMKINGNLENLQNLNRLKRLQELQSLKSFEGLDNLQSLQRLQSLKSFESLNNLNFTNKDYREIEIKNNSVVYCDIPYKGTEQYLIDGKKHSFDHEAFYTWILELAKRDDVKIFISEYTMPEDRFCKIKEFLKVSFMSAKSEKRGNQTDNIFIPRCQQFDDPTEEDVLPMFRGWRG